MCVCTGACVCVRVSAHILLAKKGGGGGGGRTVVGVTEIHDRCTSRGGCDKGVYVLCVYPYILCSMNN